VVGFFFFQAEDGIRDRTVTGVQTCALPIYIGHRFAGECKCVNIDDGVLTNFQQVHASLTIELGVGITYLPEDSCPILLVTERNRSEERRVGKECRARGGRDERGTKRVSESV